MWIFRGRGSLLTVLSVFPSLGTLPVIFCEQNVRRGQGKRKETRGRTGTPPAGGADQGRAGATGSASPGARRVEGAAEWSMMASIPAS
ncbi:hypothetical protein L596_023449 [Steinernema carpocapsae]|uniref:Uncharacterized protein n=1 Tax=Steinernema carpocapsae TaxID=34508 RepID=A0A4U5MDX0_STECR|nr:hypothetical protein L596_023449 [Steinernema carpocapsae]